MHKLEKKDNLLQFAQALNSFGKELLCPICLSLFHIASRLPCNHYFCKDCIQKYLTMHEKCPICKMPFHLEDLHDSPLIDNLVIYFKLLSNPSKENINLSQPLTPTKLIQTYTGKQLSKISPTKEMCKRLKEKIKINQKEQRLRDKKSYVFLITSLTPKQRHLVTHVCTNSSVRMVSDYCNEVTHCITSTSKNHDGYYLAKRTIKYLECLLNHKPIVSFDWITEIVKSIDNEIQKKQKQLHVLGITTNLAITAFPSIDSYLVSGDLQVTKLIIGGPQRALNSTDKLFDSMLFCVKGDYKMPLPGRDALIHLLELGGGIIVDDSTIPNVIIIMENKTKPISSNACYIHYLWILDSISNYRKEPFDSYLCTLV